VSYVTLGSSSNNHYFQSSFSHAYFTRKVLYTRKRVTCHRNIKKCRIELDNHRILNSTWVKKYNLCFSYKQMVIRVRNCYTGITSRGKLCQINRSQLLHFAYYISNKHLTLNWRWFMSTQCFRTPITVLHI